MKISVIESNHIFYKPTILFGMLLLWFFIPAKASDQTYGLKFASHDELKENRTSIDLYPGHFFSFQHTFDLSFSFSLNKYSNMYFGYIVRIIDNDNKNVDLLFNYQSPFNNGFEIVYGENLTNLTLKTDFEKLSADWTELKLSFNLENHQLIFSTPDTTMTINNIHISGKVKILFGASDCMHFKTTDVPPMNIKDIKISSKERVVHEWKLSEKEGNHAHDVHSKIKALVSNPGWISPRFFNWEKSFELSLSGSAEFAFNPQENLVYLLGENALMRYSVSDNRLDSLAYNSEPPILRAGSKAFYDLSANAIVSYNIDLKTVFTLSLENMEWDQTMSGNFPLTVYWHHNKYYDNSRRLLYMFGGYGQHEYKNQINRYSVDENEWVTVQPEGDSYSPRYLAALGHLDDSIYILGGYGSISGKQIINPQNYYDLWVYSIRGNRFFKKYDFDPPKDEIVFASSMVINDKTKEFYVFGFPNFIYESHLQLFRGSLHTPGLEAVGDKIPYFFHDIISDADLFYFDSAKKLVGLTALFDEKNSTVVSLYTIGFPPNKRLEPYEARQNFFRSAPYWIALLALLSVLIAWAGKFYFRLRRSREKTQQLPDSDRLQPESSNAFTGQGHTANCILFFGEFQIINNNGMDITNKFSPLLKELFLLIWFSSLKDKGISSERLIDILWFDKGDKNAKNNLAVNIAKLKQTIGEIDSVKLSRETGYWKLYFDDSLVFNDYWHSIKLASNVNDLNMDQAQEIINTIHKGHFLESCSFSWLDEFKADISNKMIDTLLAYVQNSKVENDSDFILHLTDAILHLDLMNEEAILLKCKALIAQGKHNLAKETFRKFQKEFKLMYNIEFDKSFVAFTK